MIVPIQSALMIFGLRLIDVSIGTIRVLMVARGRKRIAWISGFIQAMVYILAISAILMDIGNWMNIIGYAAGFATGNVIGIWVEERLAIGYTHLTIISSGRGAQISEHLRNAGYAVTSIPAWGKDGCVTMLDVSIIRKKARKVRELVEEVDEQAMVTAEHIRPVKRGFWGI
ncbi:MAG: DUF2179 domain-containing protein [Anaerolineales bacterium]|nr:DUF2179 domain-containing protein [Anaerolineales bacterium]